jgi:FkbM family methyltransferase
MWRDWAYEALGAGGWDDNALVDRNWPSTPQVIRGRLTSRKMALDLTDWMQRRTYFTGRFYQEDLEELLSALVAPGDNFVDVGANIGLVSLHAASLIGQSGQLWAFEPNPEVFARLKRHLEMNGLVRSRAFNKGLGSESGKLTLNLFGRHTGKATLVDRGAPAARTVTVEVCRGDEALKDLDPTRPTIFKIDVEGFETPVIRGLEKLLDGNVAVVIEVSKSWLTLAGSSAEELHGLLTGHGFEPYGFELAESRMTRRLVVRRLPGVLEDDQCDCLFMRPHSVFAKRLGIPSNEQQGLG